MGAAGEGETNLGDGGGSELFPEGSGEATYADAAGFGFDKDWSLGMEAFHRLMEGAFEELLGRLGADVAEEGAAMIGEGFEVENLSAGLLEVSEEPGLAGARESGEHVKGGTGVGETFLEVLQHEFAVALITTIQDARAPTDGA